MTFVRSPSFTHLDPVDRSRTLRDIHRWASVPGGDDVSSKEVSGHAADPLRGRARWRLLRKSLHGLVVGAAKLGPVRVFTCISAKHCRRRARLESVAGFLAGRRLYFRRCSRSHCPGLRGSRVPVDSVPLQQRPQRPPCHGGCEDCSLLRLDEVTGSEFSGNARTTGAAAAHQLRARGPAHQLRA